MADDDAISRELICARLIKWGYEVVVTANGAEAMAALRTKGAPTLAILDWMMRLEICRRVMALQAALAERVQELEWAGAEIHSLKMQLPI